MYNISIYEYDTIRVPSSIIDNIPFTSKIMSFPYNRKRI